MACQAGGRRWKLAESWGEALEHALAQEGAGAVGDGVDLVLVSTVDTARACEVLVAEDAPVSWGVPLRGAPAKLARARIEEIGLPHSRAEAIRSLSAAVAAGRLALDAGQDDAEAALLEIRGIGPWTAGYVALRGLGFRDAIPVSDLGLRQALGRDGEVLSPTAVEERAERWRPFRGVAAAHLWTRLVLG